MSETGQFKCSPDSYSLIDVILVLPYTVARNFRGLKFSRFSRINDEPRKFYPPKFYP